MAALNCPRLHARLRFASCPYLTPPPPPPFFSICHYCVHSAAGCCGWAQPWFWQYMRNSHSPSHHISLQSKAASDIAFFGCHCEMRTICTQGAAPTQTATICFKEAREGKQLSLFWGRGGKRRKEGKTRFRNQVAIWVA